MVPFKATYYQNKIDEFRKKIKCDRDKKYNDLELIWEIKIEKRLNGYMHSYRGDLYYTPHLYKKGELVMAVDGEEVGGLYEIVKKAYGRVGIVGLGLGYSVQEMLNKEKVNEITVYEIDEDIINLYKENFGEDDRVKIIQGDALEAQREKFDYFFVDVYNRKISKKIFKDYILYNEIHEIEDYVFFGVDRFILSLFPQKYDSEKIFKLWKDMAQISGERFADSKYAENFSAFSSKKVNELFDEFGF